MKPLKIILFFILIGLISCKEKNNDITITGKIIGSLPEKVEYTLPVNGTWFYGAKESVVPDSLGNFTISLKSNLASFVTIYIPKQASAVLLVEPGNAYEIDFQLHSEKKKVNIKGASSEALNLYNSFALPDFSVLSMSNELLKDSVLTSISSKINRLKEMELSQFLEQLEIQKISKDFYDLAVLDRTCYYSALESAIASTKYNFQADNNEIQNAQITLLWKEMFEQTPMTDTFTIRSPWSFSLMQNYVQFNQYAVDSPDKYKKQKISEHSLNIDKAKKHLKGKLLEYYFATYILSNSYTNRDSSKDLITLYEKFKKNYPNSNYTHYLLPTLQPIIDFQNKIAESTINKNVKLIENYDNINTFGELINTLRGKKVFVDIWGTWCAPCKREFAHKTDLTQLLKSKGIETLYICEGRNSKEEVWMEMIKFYDLEGHHILANKNLVTNIIKRFERNGSFAYPRYLLIDEDGIVVNEEASYPSNIKELEKEILEDFKW
ncbi:TlpA family protein disulfide reductase [Arenibacter palladensis]|uniref:TlpA family protein disulfide reductase n=1 Tax=Arenibacter palladensis TaxID=237373 RepID=UPI0026E2BCDF|nr:TlpA disulfide reductase family protein [Arenibacter palladensis]MDO6601190.1 TlpA disulfide reductase family protein [Arenibacter palladensis]